EPVETYSSSPHLFSELNIPEGSKGRLKQTPPAPSAPKAEGTPRRRRRSGGSASRSQRTDPQSSSSEAASESRPQRTRTRRRRRKPSAEGSTGAAENATAE